MTEWEPATDAEVAMRNALRTDDQESYFRILAGVDLLLPVSADALAGLAPLGWGTWSTGGRTHVLAFTSPSALQACLADYTGSARRVAYAELADTWPNLEWWLAVNPGLPIEGYLPAWFVAQLSRGDLRLPTRGPGPAGSNTPNRIQDLHTAATLAATAAAQGYNGATQDNATQDHAAAASGGPITGGSPAPVAATTGGPVGSPPGDAGSVSGGQVGPGGLPLRTPGAVLPSGLPSRVPSVPAGGRDSGIPGGQFDGFGTQPVGHPAPPGGLSDQPADQPAAQTGDSPGQPGGQEAPAGEARPAPGAPARTGAAGEVPEAYRPPEVPASDPADSPLRRPDAQLPARTPMAQTPPLTAHLPPTVEGGSSLGPGGAGAISAKLVGPGAISAKLAAQAAAMPSGPAPGRSGSEQHADEPGAGPSGLPRRQVTPPEERPATMAAAAQALAGRSPGATQPPQQQPQPTVIQPSTVEPAAPGQPGGPAHPRPGLMPPVIPGAGGAGRPTTVDPSASAEPAAATRQTTPPPPPNPSSPAGQSPDTSAPADRSAGDSPAIQGRPERPQSQSHPDPQEAAEAPPGLSEPAGSGTTDNSPARSIVASGGGAGQNDFDEDFVPANEVERDLHYAVDEGSTDSFLSTLLLATVLVPVAPDSRPGSAPGEPGFEFRTEEIDGVRFLVVFTSQDRLAEHFAEPTRTVGVRFVDLIRRWPDPAWSFAVNPTSPIGARYPGPQVIALASWAEDAGLGADPVAAPVAPPPRPSESNSQLTTMQKAVPAEQIDYYLERGYDRVAGFVHRVGEVEHLRVPVELFTALGLLYDGSPYQADAKEAFVLRWPAHRPSLYRIPYGGPSEQALRAMDGWVIERAPFRGNGFAPGEGKDVVAEFKVDSVRLPHGAQLWRLDAEGTEQLIAMFDCDVPMWRRVSEQ